MPEILDPRSVPSVPAAPLSQGAGVLPASILVHTAVPLIYEEAGVGMVEGEPGGASEPVQGDPFACVLFLPGPGGDQPNPYRPRTVRVPTLMCNPIRGMARSAAGVPSIRGDRTPILLKPEDELLVYAAELAPWTGASPARWLVDGAVQPFGKPGTVMGLLATVRQVID